MERTTVLAICGSLRQESLHRALLPGSEQFLCSQVQTPDGLLDKAPRAMARRLLRL